MKRTFKNTLLQLVIIASTTLAVSASNRKQPEAGFISALRERSFYGRKDETFHEGSGEGDGQLTGNILSATLSDGDSGDPPEAGNLDQGISLDPNLTSG